MERHAAMKCSRTVSLETVKNLRALGSAVKSRGILTPTCKTKLEQTKLEPKDSDENDDTGHDLIDVEENMQELNSSFIEVDVSLVQLHGISKPWK